MHSVIKLKKKKKKEQLINIEVPTDQPYLGGPACKTFFFYRLNDHSLSHSKEDI